MAQHTAAEHSISPWRLIQDEAAQIDLAQHRHHVGSLSSVFVIVAPNKSVVCHAAAAAAAGAAAAASAASSSGTRIACCQEYLRTTRF